MDDYIKKNVETTLENVRQAAERAGTDANDVTLVGVTKTIDLERMRHFLDTGQINLGENKVQEFCEKYDRFGKGPIWHFIGHLQTNKVKYIIDKASIIHSVDSLKLALEINLRAAKAGIVMPALIETNISGEATKFGLSPKDALSLANDIDGMSNIRLSGLMTVAPYVDKPEENRIVFKKMKNLFVDIAEKISDNKHMRFLSMGMTRDYVTAVEEGANIIRVGAGIFGRLPVN
ncbi:MAG: YggS family pyridoxal phosphate-dependent enzyme [Clostridiales bacterium]|jgi:pyridoxal phosphate enzyme (YggS family)|nr:YggS family pyridoxal phosphate-dependent enzyme [Clostridiales bacterium]